MKKIILIVITFFLVVGCNSKTLENGNSKINDNIEITKEQTINNLTMSDVLLSYKNGVSTFRVTVTNGSKESISVSKFDVVFKTENGSIITTLNGSLGDEMEGESSLNITITSDIDLSEAYSLEYQIS